MAVLFSVQSGNFTDSNSWKVVNSTSYSNTETAANTLTTSFVSSSTFTPGAITVEGIAVKCYFRAVTPSGTMSVRLFNSTGAAAVAGTTVTINVSDLPQFPSTVGLGGYWTYFKFSSPVTLLAATLYTIQATTSVATQVSLSYNGAPITNWNRCLVTSTNGTPAATDTLIVAGEHTSAGTGVDYTITFNGTGATIFGGGAATLPALEIGRRGSVEFGTTASTSYQFICNGDIRVGGGGTFSIGTSANSMPASSSAYIQFNSVSANQWGIRLRPFNNFITCGASKTGRETLAANAIVGATTITTTTSTGWLSGDEIAIAPTTVSTTAFDRRTLSSNAVGATVTITSGLTNAKTIHAGTEVEIINVTRNVRIRGGGASGTATFYSQHSYAGQTNLSVQNTEFDVGGWNNLTEDTTSTSTISFTGCSFTDVSSTITVWTDTSIPSGGSATWSDCVFLNIINFNSLATNAALNPANILIEDCWFMSMSTGGVVQQNGTSCLTINRCRFIASAAGVSFGNNQNYNNPIVITNSIFKCCTNGLSFSIGYTRSSTNNISGNKIYLNTNGLNLNSVIGWIIDSFEAFSNNGASVSVTTTANTIIRNGTITRGAAAVPSTVGISLTSTSGNGIIFENCIIGPTHTSDVSNVNAVNSYTARFRNCSMLSGTEVGNQSTMSPASIITSARHDQSDGNHYRWSIYGTQRSDDGIFRSSPLSIRLTPLSTTFKLESSSFLVPVKDGQSLTIGVWVRRSVAGDGAVYNGALPRLILKYNPSVFTGSSDVVLATATAASSGAWEYISGTTPSAIDNSAFEIVIDCDGNLGFVNFDDFFVSSQNSTRSLKYYFEGAPVSLLNSNNGSSIVLL
jgi:hypothetical protein